MLSIRILKSGSSAPGYALMARARRTIAGSTFLTILALFGCSGGDGPSSARPATPEAVRLDQTMVRLDEGGTARLNVLITESNGSTHQLGGSSVSWSIRDPEVASVQDGLITALRPGATQVTATVGGTRTVTAELVVLAVPGSVEILRGDRQAGVVGQPLLSPVRLQVLGRNGQPLTGVQLDVTPLGQGGGVSPSSPTTDANGFAELMWTLGTRAGPQAADISIRGRSGLLGVLTASAAPGAVARVEVTPSDALVRPGSRVHYGAAAVDQYGNAVPDAILTWGVQDSTVANITADGIVRAISEGETAIEARYQPPATAGLYGQGGPPDTRGWGRIKSKKDADVPEQVNDLRSPTQTTTSVTLSFTQVGDGTGEPSDYEIRYAETPIGMQFPSATVVRSGTCNSPVLGTAIGAKLTCVVDNLDAGLTYDFQLVSFRGTLGQDPVFGTVSNVATAKTSSSYPAAVEIISGNNQSGTTSTELTNPLVVRVKNSVGGAMSDVTVSWTVISGGGTVSTDQSITNSLGLAEVRWRLGPNQGPNALRASVGALSATFGANATAPTSTPTTVTVTPSQTVIEQGKSVQLAAEARDAQGQVVPNVLFNWSTTNASMATVSSGGTVYALDEGTTRVRASVGSVEGAADITVTRTQGDVAWVETLGGNWQSGGVSKDLSEPLRVRLKNTFGQPMPNTSVVWTVIKGDGSVSSQETTSDASGETQITWRLGPKVGVQEVRAASGGSHAGFQATATDGTGTTNLPGRVNSLTADSAKTDRVYLRFLEIDDGSGQAADYVVRYHVAPIGSNWSSAAEAVVGTCANLQGTSIGAVRHCSVGGLSAGVTYDFQIIAYRDEGGSRVYSEQLSNVASRSTLAPSGGQITVSPNGATLTAIGATRQFAATARDGSGNVIANPGVSWTSSNPSIATINSSGVLTAKGVGTVVVTAAAACCATANVTVVVQQSVASVSVSPSSLSLTRGESTRLTATARDANGNAINGVILNWGTGNASIASVGSDGTVRGEGDGSTTITASRDGTSAAAAVTVEDVPPSTGGGNWPNEPTGMTLVGEDNWHTPGEWKNLGGSDDVWTGNGWTRKNHDVRIVSVSGLPTGSSRALEIKTPAGTPGGYGPWAYFNNETSKSNWGGDSQSGFREVYFGYWTRMDANFFGHASGSNKHANLIGRTPSGSKTSFWAMPWGGGRLSVYDLRFDASAGMALSCGHTVMHSTEKFTSGEWHQVEIWYRKPLSTGAGGHWKVWIDGVLVQEHSSVCDYGFGSSSYIFGVGLHGTWGGIGDYLPQDNYQHFGPYRVSGRTRN